MKQLKKKLKEDLKLNVLFTKKHIDDNNELYEKMHNIWICVKNNLNNCIKVKELKKCNEFIINDFKYEITALSHVLTNKSVAIITLTCNDDKCNRRKIELYERNDDYFKYLKIF